MSVSTVSLDSRLYTLEYFMQEDVCRLCWSKDATTNLFCNTIKNEDGVNNIRLIDKIQSCVSLDLNSESNFPKKICGSCCVNIENYYEFKTLCWETDKKLHEIFAAASAKTGPEEGDKVVVKSVKAEGEDIHDFDESDSLSNLFDIQDSPQSCKEESQGNVKDQLVESSFVVCDNDVVIIVNKPTDNCEGNPDKNKHRAEKKGLFYCNVCRIDFHSKEAVTKHNFAIHSIEPNGDHKCVACDKRYAIRSSCIKHETFFCKALKNGYPCKMCGQRFDKRITYEEHLKGHGLNKVIDQVAKSSEKCEVYCKICHFTFKTVEVLAKHNLEVHGIDADGLFRCLGCGKTFKQRKLCLNHESQTCCSIKDGYKCKVCGVTLIRRYLYEAHMRGHCLNNELDSANEQSNQSFKVDIEVNSGDISESHQDMSDDDDDFMEASSDTETPKKKSQIKLKKKKLKHKRLEQCKICWETFHSEKLLSEHKLEKHGSEQSEGHRCFGCQKAFKSRFACYSHQRRCQHLKDGYKCTACSRYLPTLQLYKAHMRDHSLNKVIDLPEDLFKCSKCQQRFTTKESLTQHSKEHKPRTHICEFCGRAFNRRANLLTHKHTHTGEKRYACPHCPYRTCTGSSFTLHLRTHTGERPYSCDMCPQRCVSMSNLKAHRLRHLKVKKYQCLICSKKFGYKESLEDHIAVTHEGALPHICPVCGANFSRPWGLRRHMTKNHGDQTTRRKRAKLIKNTEYTDDSENRVTVQNMDVYRAETVANCDGDFPISSHLETM